MMIRVRLRRLTSLVLPVLAACGGADGHAGREAQPGRLDGRWSVELRLEQPMQLRGDTARAGTVRGEIALIDNPLGRSATGLGGRPTHSGSYAADFTPFGFTTSARHVPTAVARLLDPDSVEIVLDPEPGHPLVLAGRLASDSVAGHWRYAWGRSAGAAGRFVMRRR
jgi:hypothetical protein